MTKGMRIVAPKGEHEACSNELIAVFRRHQDRLRADEMLAIASHFVGQIVALQDQRKVTPQEAMRIVAANIEKGNRQVIRQRLGAAGETA